ncbi:MAG: branched-chain amino acid ABC transporter permease [Rhodoferax sp.]
MEAWLPFALSGLSYGLLLFLLSAGLTLIYSLMGVLNFAHAAFYMLGAYLGASVAPRWGFGAALVLAPLAVGLLGAALERWVLRRIQGRGHVPELLMTLGWSYCLVELVQAVWGRAPLSVALPPALAGAWWVGGVPVSALRLSMMALALAVLLVLAVLARSHSALVIRAALTQPAMTQALGHDVPALKTRVFGLGCALAALAGVMGGMAFVTEPGMAEAMGALVFVVIVVGGVGSLAGAFWASLGIGVLQTACVQWDWNLAALWPELGIKSLQLSQFAPVLPFALMVAVLIWRPHGLWGQAARAVRHDET